MKKNSSHRVKLVIFDVEGVLIPKYLFIYELSKGLGFFQLVWALIIGFLYQIGLLNLKLALEHIFRMTKGLREEKLLEIAKKVHTMPHVKETVETLRSGGCKIAVISSGLPSIVVGYFASEIGADYVFGFDSESSNQTLTGRIGGTVINRNGKREILAKILYKENLAYAECAAIVDDRNNLSMLHSDMIKIGYNPDFMVRMKADHVVSGNIDSVLPILAGKPPKPKNLTRNDLLREAIHFSAITIPVLVIFFGLSWVALLISATVVVYTASEVVRLEGRGLPIISRITSLAASESELYEFAAAPIYFAAGILLTLLVFPTPESYAAVAIFAVGDSSASLLGGLSRIQNPLNKGKTIGGSIGGFAFAFLAGCAFITPWKALFGALVAMTIEALPSPLNDNITIPLSAALAMVMLP